MFAVSCLLCARSLFFSDLITWGRAGGDYVSVYSGQGLLVLTVLQGLPKDQALSWISAPVMAQYLKAKLCFPTGTLKAKTYWLWFILEKGAFNCLDAPPSVPLLPMWCIPFGGSVLSGVSVAVPGWGIATFWFVPIGVTAALPVVWLAINLHRRSLRRRRLAAGLCLECGYDLRGSKDRCPECGTPVPEPRGPKPEV